MSESPRLEELRRRVQGDPASIAFAALAEEYRRAGRFRDAVDTSRAGLRHHPTYVSARVTLGRSLMELQELEQAERELAFVLRSAPDNLAARRALGELCWQRLRFADALTHFRAARALAPNDRDLPGIVASLERELEAERAPAEPPPGATTATTPAATLGTASPATPATTTAATPATAPAPTPDTAPATLAMAPATGAATPNGAAPPAAGSAAIARLERFYRSILRARDGLAPGNGTGL